MKRRAQALFGRARIFRKQFYDQKIDAKAFPNEDGMIEPLPSHDQQCKNEKDRIEKSGNGEGTYGIVLGEKDRQHKGKGGGKHEAVREGLMDLRYRRAPAFIAGKDRTSPDAKEYDEIRQLFYLVHGSF